MGYMRGRSNMLGYRGDMVGDGSYMVGNRGNSVGNGGNGVVGHSMVGHRGHSVFINMLQWVGVGNRGMIWGFGFWVVRFVGYSMNRIDFFIDNLDWGWVDLMNWVVG